MYQNLTISQIDEEIKKAESELKDVHGTKTEVYARIVGYYRAVGNWNQGKRSEFDLRKQFIIEDEKNSANKAISAEVQTSTAQSGIAYYEMFTRKTCPNCPPVKDFMASLSLTGTNIDVDTEEGLAEAAKKGVFAAPTVIVYNSDGTECARAHSTEELTCIFEGIPA